MVMEKSEHFVLGHRVDFGFYARGGREKVSCYSHQGI